MHDDASERGIYWNQYYNHKDIPDIPSQFAVFVLNEHQDIPVIIDVGCGNGRDTLFFLRHGVCAVGVDGSSSAIEVCKQKVETNKLSADFVLGGISDTALHNNIQSSLERLNRSGPILIYSRFFLHAITDGEEAEFIKLSSKLIDEYGGKVAVEFRTERDRLQPKATGSHFRRYVDPVHFFSRVEKCGFEVEYFAEGFGFAKYKSDDAHVARFLLKKNTVSQK